MITKLFLDCRNSGLWIVACLGIMCHAVGGAVEVVRDGDAIRLDVLTELDREYALEVSDDLKNWFSFDKQNGTGGVLHYELDPEDGGLFVRFVVLDQGALRGPVDLPLTRESGFSDSSADLADLLQDHSVESTDDLFRRMGSVYQVNSEVKRLQDAGVPVDSGDLLHLLREAEIRTNLKDLEDDGFRRELTDRLVRSRVDFHSLHERMRSLYQDLEPTNAGMMRPMTTDGPTEMQLRDHYVALRNELIESGPLDFSFAEFIALRDHMIALDPLDPGVLATGAQSSNDGTGLGSLEPTIAQLETELDKAPPPTTSYIPEIIRERLIRSYIFPDLPLMILGTERVSEDPPLYQSVGAQPPATEDREDGYRHFMINETGLAWFTLTVGGTGRRLQIDSPDGVRVIDVEVENQASYGFLLPIFDEHKGRYWRVSNQQGLALRLIEITPPVTVVGDVTRVTVPDYPLPVPFRDNWFSGAWLRFRTQHDAASSGYSPNIALEFHARDMDHKDDQDEENGAVPVWQALLLADRITDFDAIAGYDEPLTTPIDNRTGNYDLFILPSANDAPMWTFDSEGNLVMADLFPIDWARRNLPRPRFDLEVEMRGVETRPFVLGLIDQVAFARDGESDGRIAEVKLTFNANIAPYFPQVDAFSATVGDPLILEGWRAWVSLGESASAVLNSGYAETFQIALALLRDDGEFDRFFQFEAMKGVPPGRPLRYNRNNDNHIMQVFSMYLSFRLGSSWYQAIDEAESLYANWMDTVVQINSFRFPYGQYYNMTDSKSEHYYDPHSQSVKTRWWYYHPVIPVNVPLFAMPKDRMATEVRPIQSSYFGMEIDKLNRWAIFGAVLRGVVNAALAIGTGNWGGAICDGVNMVASIQKVLADAEDDPIGSANFSLNRASSDHGFFGLDDDRLQSFQMSGYPEGNDQHLMSGPMEVAQLACSMYSMVSATGGPLVTNPIGSTQQFWTRIQAGEINDIVEQINAYRQMLDSQQEIVRLTDLSQALIEGRLQDALDLAASWTEFGSFLQEGQDLFESYSELRENRPFIGGAASLGHNLSHSEIYFHFGDYKNRKTTARSRVGTVRSVPARHIEVHFTRAWIFDLKEASRNLPAEIFVNARVGVIADKGPESWSDVPMQHVGPDGQLLLENGSISSGYTTLPNLPFVAYTRKSYPVRKFGQRYLPPPDDVSYYPEPGDTAVFNATWSDDVNTAAIYVEVGVYEDDGPRIDDDMIGVYSRTFLLEDLIKDPSSGWHQQENGRWILEVRDYPLYDESNLETLVRITEGVQRESQIDHNRQRLLNPSAMVSFYVEMELADFVRWQDDFEYDVRPHYDVADLSNLTPRVVASGDEPIAQVLGYSGGRALTRSSTPRGSPRTLRLWRVVTGDEPALEDLALLSPDTLPQFSSSVFTSMLSAQLARNGDFVVVLHYDGLTVLDVRDPADITATHYDGRGAYWPSRMAVDVAGDLIYLSYRHPDYDLEALQLSSEGFIELIAENHNLPDTVVGLLALPQGGVMVHLMNRARIAPAGGGHGVSQASAWGFTYDGMGFLTDEDLVWDDRPVAGRNSLRTMRLNEGTGGIQLLSISELDLRGNVSGEQLINVINHDFSSIFTRYDNQTFIAGHGLSQFGFAVQIDPDLFFMDPRRINSTQEVFKEVIDIRKASVGWGFWSGSKPTTSKKVGEHWINQLIGVANGPYIVNDRLYSQLHPTEVYRAYRESPDPVSPFNVFTPQASEAAFGLDAFRVGARDIHPLKDGDLRFYLVRGDDSQPPPLNHRASLGLRGEGRLMLVDIMAPDPVNPTPEGMVRVEGGALPPAATPDGPSEFGGISVESFFLGVHELTWGEWKSVRTWAISNAYPDLNDVGMGCQSNHPVTGISWFDMLKWCNAKSEMEGLDPVYSLDGAVLRTGEFEWFDSNRVQWNAAANGYRLPTEREWEYAARGGSAGSNTVYSGGDVLDLLGWYNLNSDGAPCAGNLGLYTRPVGSKAPNELGLYDMSGNVSELVWDRGEFYDEAPYGSGYTIRHRGGNALFPDALCTVADRGEINGDQRWTLNGFRLARNLPHHPERQILIQGDPDFGKVLVGNTAQSGLLISNDGEGALTVVAIFLPEGFSADYAGGQLQAGESIVVTIQFGPLEEKDYDGLIGIHTNTEQGLIHVPVVGSGVPLTDPPFAAFPVRPIDGATYVDQDMSPTLSWSVGMDAQRPAHYSRLYFSTDHAAVAGFDPETEVLGDGRTLHDEWMAPSVLQSGTTYYWRVLTGNASGVTSSDVFTFSTAAPVMMFPYFEGFDDFPVPPDGWRNLFNWSGLDGDDLQPDMGGGSWMMGFDPYVHSGAGSISISPWVMPAWYWLISPTFELPPAPDELRMRFHVYYDHTPEEPTELYLMVKRGDSWEMIRSWTSAADVNQFDVSLDVNLGAYAGESVTFAFVYNANAFGSLVAVDEWSVGF